MASSGAPPFRAVDDCAFSWLPLESCAANEIPNIPKAAKMMRQATLLEKFTTKLLLCPVCRKVYISSSRFNYQTTFSANWICREVVDVESTKPAPPTGAPVPSKIILLSVGGLKLGRLRILKNSVRNCTLKVSEILLIGLFLNSDMSKVPRPGPTRVFLPELTSRFAQ